MSKRKIKLTDQDERDLEDLNETYDENLVDWFNKACAGLTRTKHHAFKYISHEIFIDVYDEFFIAVKFKVDSLEDTINIPFYAIDDFNYDDNCVDHRVLDLDAQANIDGLPYSVWSDERRLLRLAYLIWMEVRSWL